MSHDSSERIDSDSIRQGLLSIRNSQLELLNELKIETQQLKKTPLRFNTSTEDSRTETIIREDYLFTNPPENVDSGLRYNPISPSPDKPFSFGVTNDRNLESQLAHLRDQNKMLNESLQKVVYSRSSQKQRVRQLETYLYFNCKISYQIINQLLSNTSLSEVRRTFQSDLKINEDVYAKYSDGNHAQIMELLREKEIQGQQLKIGSGISNLSRDQGVTSQLGQLKEQLVMLLRSNQKGQSSNPLLEMENKKLKDQNDVLTKKCQQLAASLGRLQIDNQELALCWQRQINQRKLLIAEVDRIKKDKSSSVDNDKQISSIQTDYEAKLARVAETVKEKEVIEAKQRQEIKELVLTLAMLKEESQKLKKEVRSVEELKSSIRQENMEASKARQSQLASRIAQHGNLLRHYQQENFELKNHLAEMRRRFEMMAESQNRQRESEAINHQIYMRKVQAIKSNSTVEHLWQVKRVEYENINQLLQQVRDKGIRA